MSKKIVSMLLVLLIIDTTLHAKDVQHLTEQELTVLVEEYVDELMDLIKDISRTPFKRTLQPSKYTERLREYTPLLLLEGGTIKQRFGYLQLVAFAVELPFLTTIASNDMDNFDAVVDLADMVGGGSLRFVFDMQYNVKYNTRIFIESATPDIAKEFWSFYDAYCVYAEYASRCAMKFIENAWK